MPDPDKKNVSPDKNSTTPINRPKFDASAIYPDVSNSNKQDIVPQIQVKQKSTFAKLRPLIFTALLILLFVSFFLRHSYQLVRKIDQASYLSPSQTATTGRPFSYGHRGVNYQITPVFDYKISGMVVSRRDYEKLPEAKTIADNTLLPIDLCIIWGYNLKSGVHKSFSTRFSQYNRFCSYTYGDGKAVADNAISNNHLLFVDNSVKEKMKGIKAGDQITITGKLINVQSPSGIAPESIVNRHSSTTRTDTDDGACEDILVENVEVLKSNPDVFQKVFMISLIGLPTVALSSTLRNRFKKKYGQN